MTVQNVDIKNKDLTEKIDNMKPRLLLCRECSYRITTDIIGVRCPDCDLPLYTKVEFML